MNAAPLVGWCAEHDGMAMLYDDGSIDCHHLAIVEMFSDDCRMEQLPLERLYVRVEATDG